MSYEDSFLPQKSKFVEQIILGGFSENFIFWISTPKKYAFGFGDPKMTQQ